MYFKRIQESNFLRYGTRERLVMKEESGQAFQFPYRMGDCASDIISMQREHGTVLQGSYLLRYRTRQLVLKKVKKRYSCVKFLIAAGTVPVRQLFDKSSWLRDFADPISGVWNPRVHCYKGTKWTNFSSSLLQEGLHH